MVIDDENWCDTVSVRLESIDRCIWFR